MSFIEIPSYTPEIVPVIKEKIRIGELQLLLARGCSESTAALLEQKISQTGLSWIERHETVEARSRRQVAIIPLDAKTLVVVKKKREIRNGFEMKLKFFSTSIVHEFRTAFHLKELMESLPLPQTLEYHEEEYALTWDVALPLAAILNLNDPSERYVIFEYLDAESVKEEVDGYGGWGETPESKRELFSRFHDVLNQIAPHLVERGLEPWDLGSHQLVYTLNEETKQIYLGILDTEEYNFSARYGDHWPDTHSPRSLPQVIVMSKFF